MQFPLFSEAGRARFNDDQRIWGKASPHSSEAYRLTCPDSGATDLRHLRGQGMPLFRRHQLLRLGFRGILKGYVVEDFHSAGILICALVPGWSVARVGEVQAYAGSTPTILEHLLYWISSSMHEPGTYHRPEVGSERVLPSEECPCLVYDVMAKNPRAALALCLLD